jgi:uncharacterized protein
VILVDTGPIVALFDPADSLHSACLDALRPIREPLGTTTPVLTEAFHLLTAGSIGCGNLMRYVREGGLTIWFFGPDTLDRAFELMDQYSDHPMDLADASLVVMAEAENARKVFTIDRADFASYRIKRGHRYHPFELIAPSAGRS